MLANRETLLCRYHYDALDRLVGCEPAQQSNIQRFYLKSRLTTEIQGPNQCSIFQQEDQLLGQQRRQGGAVETALLVTDQQRSVLQTFEAAQQHSMTYSPYGHRALEGGLFSVLGFNGEHPDPLTGHYVLGNGYRAFNPVLMRFNSPDNWSPFGDGGLNAYAYCAGDPVNRRDPTGHALLIKALMMFKEARAIKPVATPLGDFQTFAGMPHVMENIAGNLSGPNLANFSKASTATRSIAQRFIDALGDLTPLAGDPLKKIAGYLPGDDLVSFALASKEMQKNCEVYPATSLAYT